MLTQSVITLTTDFGIRDPFAGIMKGVILGINPEAHIVDITHGIQQHNIPEASRVISASVKYFPSRTIHIVVVDPGVGSTRRPVLVSAGEHFFIGPDNGVFTAIYNEFQDGIEVIHITSSDYFLHMSGPTFHGRDLFAPVAAWLSKGTDIHSFGHKINDYETIDTELPEISYNTIRGKIVSIDNFGNCISNIREDDLKKIAPAESKGNFSIRYGDTQVPFFGYYAESDRTSLSAVINSFGHLELFVYLDSAAVTYNIKKGDILTVTRIQCAVS